MKKTWTLLALLLLGCTAACLMSNRGTPANQTGQQTQENAAQPPTEAGTWLIYFAEQGVDLWQIISFFGPPNAHMKGPWFDWRTSNDRFELHQWDDLGVWVETGWDDGEIRDMGFGKVIRFYGGEGPGY